MTMTAPAVTTHRPDRTRRLQRGLFAVLLSAVLLVFGVYSSAAADGYTGSDSIAVSENSVQPGQSIVVFASGFESGSTVSIVLQPGGTVLGTAAADSRGRIEVAVEIPRQAAVGTYMVEASGVNGQQPVELSIAIVVTASGRPLPATGGNFVGILLAATACASLGAIIVVRFRRHRAA